MLKMVLRSLPRSAVRVAALKTTSSKPQLARPPATALSARFGKVPRLYARSFASSVDFQQSADYTHGDVAPPNDMDFNPVCVNTATLTGIVLEDPETKPLANDNFMATIKLAVPRYIKRENTEYEVYRVVLFGFVGQQAGQHVRKGQKIVVQGRLSTFNDVISLSANEFHLLADRTWPYTSEPNPATTGKRKVATGYVSASQRRVYDDYRNGKTMEEISAERKLKPATVLGYLAANAYTGEKVDFAYLTRQCFLGPPGGSYMETDAICAAVKEMANREGIAAIGDLPIQGLVEVMKKHRNGEPYRIQEKLVTGVTYVQVQLVVAMMKQGLQSRDWNAFSTPGNPVPPY